MPIIKSISGIRGTIGASDDDNLTLNNTLNFSLAFGTYLKKKYPQQAISVLLGRDARKSGLALSQVTSSALLSLGINVLDLGLTTTPALAYATSSQGAQGAIMLSASHNPSNWNAIKLFNDQGEYINAKQLAQLLNIAKTKKFSFTTESLQGLYTFNPYLEWEHIVAIKELALVRPELIAKTNLRVAVDPVNSVGAKAVGHLLEVLGVREVITINDSMDGNFAHNPEPIGDNLSQLQKKVRQEKADLGIAVDPDVDRLALVDGAGEVIGEEYTLVLVAKYVLENFAKVDQLYPGQFRAQTVSNLSSSRALVDLSRELKAKHSFAKVGELNVVEKMKQTKAVIGGEGNGGVIYPPLHYGRDALLGIALILSYLAKSKQSLAQLKTKLPQYHLIKEKIALKKKIKPERIFATLKKHFQKGKISEIDGLKIDLADSWLQVRLSNTEPIIRVFTEAKTKAGATKLKREVFSLINTVNKN